MRFPKVTRLVVATVLGLFLVPATAMAAPSPTPTATAVAQNESRPGGVIEGKVSNVDYSRGVVTVDSNSQGRVDVTTMPTTSVQSDDPGYHTITDVQRGSRVQIFFSRTAGKVIAQIIRLLKR
ncbi:MAG: hypothetical protein JO103_07775 [Candidatus Eremiobacteraeota bacterium]|nr:hypothetical protein [Candidatus Eremiobacteraeota bacterium]MBV9408326.1 hypothetical protein [Candidatus Eremiobacteraeota bacterium]